VLLEPAVLFRRDSLGLQIYCQREKLVLLELLCAVGQALVVKLFAKVGVLQTVIVPPIALMWSRSRRRSMNLSCNS